MIMEPLQQLDAELIAPSPSGEAGVRGLVGRGTKPLTLTLSQRERAHGSRSKSERSLEAALSLSIGFHDAAIPVYCQGERLFPQVVAQLQAPVGQDWCVDHTDTRRVESL